MDICENALLVVDADAAIAVEEASEFNKAQTKAAWASVVARDAPPAKAAAVSSINATAASHLKSIELCPFAINARCKYNENCKYTHGEQCFTCMRFVLHPTDAEQRAIHTQECHSAPNGESAEASCGICFEVVAKTGDSRFGLLNCMHAFCLGCIKTWRTNNEKMSIDCLRSCPICRTVTHFVTPSPIWPSDAAEKERIIERYKQKLASIDCKHFDRGAGTCPFGSSCFYAHRDRFGNAVDPALLSRVCLGSDGAFQPLPSLKASEFFGR